MANVVLLTESIKDWKSFHSAFAQLLGFPKFYGGNMDAWIDCMSSLAEDDGMSAVKLGHGESLSLQIHEFEAFARSCPEICSALLECTAFVNQRYKAAGEATRINLVLE